MTRRLAGFGLVVLAATTRLQAQGGPPASISGLGSLVFPVSTASNAAREAFERGVLLLHLFHYGDARGAFREAERLDPGMTMAYWGEALAWTYPIWNVPHADSGRAALAQLGPTPAARAAKARTPRERGYLEALEPLYGDGAKAVRDTLYASAMEHLSRAYPKDDEAKLFYTLALMGLSQGVRNVPTYLKAADLAEEVFRRQPNHPGAEHYLIHAVDDPDHATRGLDAARALSRTAPDAHHAQHMTSHIFMALGLWDDVVAANENAVRVASRDLQNRGRAPDHCGHYITWLNYGYLQQGRFAEARELTRQCQDQGEASLATAGTDGIDPDESDIGSAVWMWSRYLLDTAGWDRLAAGWQLAVDTNVIHSSLNYHFTKSLAAARRGDGEAAGLEYGRFRAAYRLLEERTVASPEPPPDVTEDLKRLAVLDLELQALIRDGDGRGDSAVALLRRATAIEDGMAYAFGPPTVNKPSHELLGEQLLAMRRAAEAREEFARALRRTPRRAAALLGLARAEMLLGGPAEAARSYAELSAIWHAAGVGVPGLAEARTR